MGIFTPRERREKEKRSEVWAERNNHVCVSSVSHENLLFSLGKTCPIERSFYQMKHTYLLPICHSVSLLHVEGVKGRGKGEPWAHIQQKNGPRERKRLRERERSGALYSLSRTFSFWRHPLFLERSLDPICPFALPFFCVIFFFCFLFFFQVEKRRMQLEKRAVESVTISVRIYDELWPFTALYSHRNHQAKGPPVYSPRFVVSR